MSVSPTRIDSDTKRLLRALAVSLALHGSLLVFALIVMPVGLAPRPFSGAAPRSFAVTLLDTAGSGSAGTYGAGVSPAVSHPATELSLADEVTPVETTIVPVIADNLAVRESGSVDDNGSANAGGLTAVSGTAGPSSIGSAAFASWLDDQLKRRLAYPERARRRSIEGTVVIALTVSADGSVCRPSIREASGSALLDVAALDLVRSLFPSPVSPGANFTDSVKIQYRLDGDL